MAVSVRLPTCHLLACILLLAHLPDGTHGERCPSLFGQFECPVEYNCIENECYSGTSNETAPMDCEQVKCSTNTRCYKGRCYPAAGLPCNRNVQLSDTHFQSVTSSCGLKGRCLNGRCVEDRCSGMTCTQNELCRDGTCWMVVDTFCITHFDCGPIFECHKNKCLPLQKPIPCNCDPGEVCQQGHCFPDSRCAHVSCATDSFCTEGVCQSAVGRDCTSSACEGGTICVEGRCILDPCTNRCPPDHACREGQCRHLQGLSCHTECPQPYLCIDGRCAKNECFGVSCQIGEACENGLCIKVEGRLCSLAIRDCAEGFECIQGICHDLIQSLPETEANGTLV